MSIAGTGQTFVRAVSDRITQVTTGPRAILALAAFFILGYLINGRPFGIAELKSITDGVGILDMEFLYSPDQAYAHLAAMGEAGRAFELTHIIPLDLLLPAVYATAYALIITWLLHRWLPAESGWHRLNVVPLIGGICDYCENLGIIAMLLAWPAQLPDIALFTMVAGSCKFAASALAFTIIFGALLGWAVSAAKARCSGSPGNGPQDT